jgi:hypothetical protein
MSLPIPLAALRYVQADLAFRNHRDAMSDWGRALLQQTEGDALVFPRSDAEIAAQLEPLERAIAALTRMRDAIRAIRDEET